MAYTENASFARIYSDRGTGVWVAPVGTALPIDLADPGAAFKPVGWLGEDGISLQIDKDVKDHNALQGGALIRRKVSKVTQTFTFVALEETALVLGLVYADQAITVTGVAPNKIATHSIVNDQAKTVTRTLVVDTVDGTVMDRYALATVDLTFKGEIQLAGADLRAYKFEATIIAGSTANHITNSTGVITP